MIIATWNVNSIRMRVPRLQDWLTRRRPDVVCLQETKVVDEDFPLEPFRELGYHCLVSGQKTYNGVAILSKTPASDPVMSLPGDGPDADRRLLAATVEGIRVVNLYAPNGGEVGSDKYDYKLDWYRRLRGFLDADMQPDAAAVLCGDFNVAPEDRDVWDPDLWRGKILFSEPERSALASIVSWGLCDALRLHHPEGGLYTWWDYRAGAFHRGWGVRIDHILITQALIQRCADVEIDRDERKGPKPSDHAPVLASFRGPAP